MPIRRFSIVTPVFNARERIAATAESVLGQSAVRTGRVTLDYVIQDGGSTDGTAELARDLCGDRATVVSARDSGMYDALGKGLARADGDVTAYLNAGDEFAPTAFDVVADVMEQRPDVRWVTGMFVLRNGKNQVVRASVPFRYGRRLLRRGAYGRVLPFVQQESTFWRSDLNARIDPAELRAFRLAGDLFIWTRFAEVTELHVVEALLGGFTVHPGQLSSDQATYRREAEAICGSLGPFDRLSALYERALWWAPPGVKKRLSGGRLLRYDFKGEKWV